MKEAATENRQTVTVQAPCGGIRGRIEDGVAVFRGIPYAKDYTGAFRFHAAQPADPWSGVREAFAFPPALYQLPKKLGGVTEGMPMAEDSLCVNVWRPENAGDKLPVMLWIYGGAFATGDCGMDLYDGQYLARGESVIVVTFNYRVNAMGFLDFSSLDASCDPNPGLKDQVLALEWVYRNIAAFGGDPENVTIFGQSAGALSVTTLLAVPSARKYIAKAIALSAYPASVNTKEQSAAYAEAFLRLLGTDDMQKLYSMPPQLLTDTAKQLEQLISARRTNELAHLPVVDGAFLPRAPMDAAAAPPDDKRIPLILGNVRNEATIYGSASVPFFASNEETVASLLDHFGDDQAALDRAYAAYPQPLRAAYLGGDALFRAPSYCYADRYCRHDPVWMYRFDYYTLVLKLKKFYAMHGIDMAFAFRHLTCAIGRTALMLTPFRAQANALAARFSHELAAFAKTGAASWTAYDPENRTIKVWNAADHIEEHSLSRELAAWKQTRYYQEKIVP